MPVIKKHTLLIDFIDRELTDIVLCSQSKEHLVYKHISCWYIIYVRMSKIIVVILFSFIVICIGLEQEQVTVNLTFKIIVVIEINLITLRYFCMCRMLKSYKKICMCVFIKRK